MSSNQMDVSLLGKIAGYTEILAKDPNSTIFVPLGEAYRQMGLLDDALDIVLKGVRALPRFSPGYTALARIYAQRGDLDRAVSAYERALAIDDESTAALKGLARIRLQRGERAAARALLERLAALEPDDATVRQALAGLAAAVPASAAAPVAGSVPPARTPEGGGPIATPTIAELYIRQGFPSRALKVYRDLLEADPHNEAIRQRLVALKEQIAGAPQPPVPQPSVEQPVEPDESPNGGYVRVLHRWLEAIEERRGHVR